jgi:hypothetical protein
MQKKYYDSQVFNEDSELSEAKAFERNCYVACYFLENVPKYAELLENGKVYRVVYYNQSWPPNESILKQQLSRKERTQFELVSPSEYLGSKEIVKHFCFKADGSFSFTHEKHFSLEGNLLLEVYRDTDHNITGSTEYEYDDAEELLFIREYNADGKMVSELDYVDYYA